MSVVCTRHNIGQLDEFKAIADRYGAQLRLTRLRPSGRGADVWEELHPLPEQQRELYDWLVAHGDQVLTGDSFFHLVGLRRARCPASTSAAPGRVVCLIDPVGDVYACPFAIHDQFLAGNVRDAGGFDTVWQHSRRCSRSCASPQTGGACTQCSAYDSCRGGCMAAKFFTGLPLDGPDPECVKGNATDALAGDRILPGARRTTRTPGTVRNAPVPLTLLRRPPDTACDESPLAAPARSTGQLTCPGPRPTRGPRASCAGRGSSGDRPLLLVPVGSMEQHGPAPAARDGHHDRLRGDPGGGRPARRAAGRRVWSRRRSSTARAASTRTSPAPSRSATRRCGCCSSSSPGRRAGGPGGVVFVNGHGGNAADADATPSSCCAARTVRSRGRRLLGARCRRARRAGPRPRCCGSSRRGRCGSDLLAPGATDPDRAAAAGAAHVRGPRGLRQRRPGRPHRRQLPRRASGCSTRSSARLVQRARRPRRRCRRPAGRVRPARRRGVTR